MSDKVLLPETVRDIIRINGGKLYAGTLMYLLDQCGADGDATIFDAVKSGAIFLTTGEFEGVETRCYAIDDAPRQILSPEGDSI